MYQHLIACKKQHRTILVPRRYKDEQHLGTWVYLTAMLQKEIKTSIERTNYLESIVFVWKTREYVPWIERYERLVADKTLSSVDAGVKKSHRRSLSRWVNIQQVA